ncbi:hypothetical protein [Pedobacter sp. MC2016-24]|uniref:hypothetical protein n=1 Tax=Pedobacter sp. MC2016-24 TaxID=2780090 RepID=UPI00187E9E84|nr:hypothetical protein [Pedobacter sp. MC2016-24]MBE9599385.1 hypothetical protein [Pedobacter sp. MC2016-24]
MFSLIIINGCKREQIISEKSSLSRNDLTVIDNTKINISSPALSLDLEPFSELTQTQIQNLDEIQAADLLQPAVESGTILYNELMAQVVGTPAWSALTYVERDYIQNFTPQQKAMLAILYEAESNVASASSNSKWVNCAHYVDSSYTTFVPDGYYSPPHIQATVYKIVEGVSIAAYTIEPI